MRTLLTVQVAALAAVLALLAGPAGATAQERRAVCTDGRTACIDALVREMERRFRPLARTCDHDAVFSLAYLRTTQGYRDTVARDPAFFEDTRAVNRLAVSFAQAYFAAYDAWHGGRRGQVPPAWAIALRTADERAVSGAGSLLLGMSAHIARDLPFVLARWGLRRADGASRKPDHDEVNEILRRVYGPLVDELARRFDPAIRGPGLPTGLDDEALFQLVVGWREQAWRHAELLVAARTPAARAAAAAVVESYAAAQATLILAATRYPPGQTSAARDAYCAANG